MENKVKIILPEKANDMEKFAGEELKFFIKLITHIESETVCESDNFDIKSPFISLGNTKINLKKLGSLDFSSVGYDGYRIIGEEGAFYVKGGESEGTIFGVYRLLKELFNLTIYTEDLFKFDKNALIFKALDITEKPDIEMRALGIYPVHLEMRYPGEGNKRYCYRMRLRQMDEGWGINNHTYFRILPPAKYHELHPEWYDPAVKNLCLSNEEMTAEYIKNMKRIIEDTPNEHYYMFGVEDVRVFCTCPKCKALMDRFGGFTGLTIYFANKCIKELNEWIKEIHPERVGKIIFFTFAYSKCINPPVIKDEDGNYKLIDEELRPAENTGILIAPYHVCENYPVTDLRNYHTLTPRWHGKERMYVPELFDRWLSIYKNHAVWFYNAQFVDYWTPCPMWNSIEGNIRYFKSLNPRHAFMEAGCGQNVNFAAMKIYCAANLMWNTALSISDLASEFMDVYFENAKPEMCEYLRYIHDHADWLNKVVNRQMIHVHFDDEPNKRYLDERFFPIGVLQKCIDIFEKALKKDLSDVVRDRVKREALSAKFSMLYLYRDRLDKDYVLKLMDDCLEVSKFDGVGIPTQMDDCKPYSERYLEWKNELERRKY